MEGVGEGFDLARLIGHLAVKASAGGRHRTHHRTHKMRDRPLSHADVGFARPTHYGVVSTDLATLEQL